MARHGFGIPGDARRGVVAGRRQGHPFVPGELREAGEGEALIAGIDTSVAEFDCLDRGTKRPCGHVRHAVPDGCGGIEGRHAVEIRSRRGRGGYRVGDLVGACGRYLDIPESDAEDRGDHLGNLDEKTLSHLGAAMVEVDTSVRIDMDESTGLVEARHVEGDAELGRHHRDALLQRPVCGIEALDVLAGSLPVRGSA